MTILRQYTIGKHFVPAIAYDDTSGLSRDESIRLDDFLLNEIEPHITAFYGCRAFFAVDWETIDEPDNFQTCDITRVLADCCTVYLQSK